MPTASTPLTEGDGKTPSQAWWRFWFELFSRSAATIQYLTATGLTATGTTQADALALTAEWNEVTTTPANSGVRLNSFGKGLTSTVFNAGANPLDVYPPVGGAIDALGTNNPYILAAGRSQTYYQLSTTAFRSTQLG